MYQTKFRPIQVTGNLFHYYLFDFVLFFQISILSFSLKQVTLENLERFTNVSLLLQLIKICAFKFRVKLS